MLNANVMALVSMSAVVGSVVGSMLSLFPYLRRKNVNVDKVLGSTNKVLTATKPIINVAQELFPNNPEINLVKFIEERSEKAVKTAQQLNDSGKLSLDERNQTAKDNVYAALKEINITPTENQKKLINDAIEAAVYDLPHATPDVKKMQAQAEAAQSQLKAQNAQVQEQLVKTQQENTQLKQTIATVTSAVQANKPVSTIK